MKTNFFHIPMLLLALPVLISACGSGSAASKIPAQAAIPVKLLPLNTGAAQAAIPVSGTFTTDDEVLLSFKTGGIIQRILVKEGDAIRQGQTVAVLNPVEIDAQVQQAQLAFEKAQRDHQRATNLYNDSVATLEQLQNARTAKEIAHQQLRTAQFNRNHSVITAPRNGYVLRKLAAEGQLVQPGTPVLQTNGAGAGNWMLRASVSNTEWAAIRLQDTASVEVESAPGRTFSGRVSRRSEGTDPATGAFTIDIKLDGTKPANIAYGLFGKAVINSRNTSAAGTWRIPYDALLDGDSGSGYVFVTNDGKTARKVKVTVAGMEKDKVIISQGLEDAGRLIISGSAYLTDGSSIRVMPDSSIPSTGKQQAPLHP
ncbi:efflux RND transporter periplasmic adaptor subunit [Chitinophaga sp. XS-30]|uniref:efflux RND transporter periplasmic adaptor subunit n=1 Tax=Chitinophaga sp. XS-30 TaxID=2604421 RepID=UPI0011DD441B|nr:efflux RND transporter periplasmic adaptor subunit [Chitinophaga sp. XS-30]QEH42717.1 efflux RND transporter periplasmic adaptor subunit [Chitinophaga sp. XS-30]